MYCVMSDMVTVWILIENTFHYSSTIAVKHSAVTTYHLCQYCHDRLVRSLDGFLNRLLLQGARCVTWDDILDFISKATEVVLNESGLDLPPVSGENADWTDDMPR